MQLERITQQKEKEAETALTSGALGEQDVPSQLETFGPFDQAI